MSIEIESIHAISRQCPLSVTPYLCNNMLYIANESRRTIRMYIKTKGKRKEEEKKKKTSALPTRPIPPVHKSVTVKLNTLPSASPATRHSPMNPPAASRSSSSTASAAAIMALDASQPLLSPNGSWTTTR